MIYDINQNITFYNKNDNNNKKDDMLHIIFLFFNRYMTLRQQNLRNQKYYLYHFDIHRK